MKYQTILIKLHKILWNINVQVKNYIYKLFYFILFYIFLNK
jgi:hypothetical protein